MIVAVAVSFFLATWLAIPSSTWFSVNRHTRGQGVAMRLRHGRDGCYSPWMRTTLGITVAALIWVVINWAIALLAFIGCYVLLGQVQTPAARRQHQVLLNQADFALELLAITLSVGAPLRAAVGAVAEVVPAPTSQLLKLVQTQTEVGRSDSEAWLELAENPVWGNVARDLARSVEVGAGLVDSLELHAEEIRVSRQEDRERWVRSVGVSAVLPLMCCFLPAFLLVGVLPIIASTLGNLLSGL